MKTVKAKGVPKLMAANTGQPTSGMSRGRAKRLDIAWTAGERPLINIPNTKKSPVKPMPTRNPARKLRPTGAPNSRPRRKRMIGIITATPAVCTIQFITALMIWKIPTIACLQIKGIKREGAASGAAPSGVP